MSDKVPSKNARVVYAWRLPVIHFFVLFCLYRQALFMEQKYKDYQNPPVYIGWIKRVKFILRVKLKLQIREMKQRYWETMVDLKRKQ